MKNETITCTSTPPTMEQPDIIKAARIIGKAINAAFESLAMAIFLGLFVNGCMPCKHDV